MKDDQVITMADFKATESMLSGDMSNMQVLDMDDMSDKVSSIMNHFGFNEIIEADDQGLESQIYGTMVITLSLTQLLLQFPKGMILEDEGDRWAVKMQEGLSIAIKKYRDDLAEMIME